MVFSLVGCNGCGLNALVPLGLHGLNAGLEWQYLSARKTFAGSVPAYSLVNLTISRPVRRSGLEVSLGIYNLLDHKTLDPWAIDPAFPARDRLEQAGRALRLKLLYRF